MLGHQLEGPAQALRALPWRRRRPAGQRAGGRTHRVERVLHRPVGHLGQGVLGGRVDHRHGAAAAPAGPLAADQQPGGDVDAGQFGQVGAHWTPRAL